MEHLAKVVLFAVVCTALAQAVAAEPTTYEVDGGQLLEVTADPTRGFHYSYVLLLPDSLADGTTRLIVEPNNTGTSDDDITVHLEGARRTASIGQAGTLARRLGAPALVSVFPRPRSDWRVYTHALDRDAMLTDEPYGRPDMQLAAMITHARGVLKARGVNTHERVFMVGFSASGNFTNRFAALHPRLVRAVASGGVNGLPILPVTHVRPLLPLQPADEDRILPYPIGVGDLLAVAGASFDAEAYATVAQFIYMGATDSNDTFPYGDAWDDAERDLIREVAGETMMPDRWRRSRQVLGALDYPIQCVTYSHTDHTIRPEMLADIEAFFRANGRSEPQLIEPHIYDDVPDGEIEIAHVNGVYWSGDDRIPEAWRSLWGQETLFVSIEEWIQGQSYEQLNRFLERAQDDLVLRAEGQPEISLHGSRWGNVSTGDGTFQAVVFQLPIELMAAIADDASFTLHAVGRSEAFWIVRETVRLTR